MPLLEALILVLLVLWVISWHPWGPRPSDPERYAYGGNWVHLLLVLVVVVLVMRLLVVL